MKSFATFSFGCRVNQAEKESIDRQLLQRGLVFDEIKPDLYIINTCSVTNKAEREARQHIYQARKKFPQARIVVTGCAATNWKKLKQEVAGIDLLVDNVNKEYLVDILINRMKQTQENRQSAMATMPVSSIVSRLSSSLTPDVTEIRNGYHNRLTIPENKYHRSHRAILKIQDGCQRFCTFCIVPYLRGTPKSHRIDEIVSAINNLHLREIILTAINTEAYGYDTGESFLSLLAHVLRQTTIPRISFGSIHPWSITKEFLDFYETVQKQGRLVDFFHIPLQSGSDSILTLMKRGYTREEFREKLQRIHAIYPFAHIGTDVIVGFLEESEKEFQETYEFLEQSPISKFHIFRFSRRSHTAAFYMAKRLQEPTPAEKKKRAKALAELGEKKYQLFLQKHAGNSFDGLFIGKEEQGIQQALLSNQIPAYIKVPKNLAGEIKRVTIEQEKNGKLFGTLT